MTFSNSPRAGATILAAIIGLSGCCENPPATVEAPAVESASSRIHQQTTVTIQHSQNSQSIRIHQHGDGNVSSRVNVDSDGKVAVEEIQVGPAAQ